MPFKIGLSWVGLGRLAKRPSVGPWPAKVRASACGPDFGRILVWRASESALRPAFGRPEVYFSSMYGAYFEPEPLVTAPEPHLAENLSKIVRNYSIDFSSLVRIPLSQEFRNEASRSEDNLEF
jgi:hypothetical protein